MSSIVLPQTHPIKIQLKPKTKYLQQNFKTISNKIKKVTQHQQNRRPRAQQMIYS